MPEKITKKAIDALRSEAVAQKKPATCSIVNLPASGAGDENRHVQLFR